MERARQPHGDPLRARRARVRRGQERARVRLRRRRRHDAERLCRSAHEGRRLLGPRPARTGDRRAGPRVRALHARQGAGLVDPASLERRMPVAARPDRRRLRGHRPPVAPQLVRRRDGAGRGLVPAVSEPLDRLARVRARRDALLERGRRRLVQLGRLRTARQPVRRPGRPGRRAARADEKVVAGESCTTGSSSISGLAFYTGSTFPSSHDGALFFADYSRNCIWVMYPGAGGVPDPATRQTFAACAAGPVWLTVGRDGALYYADLSGGTLRRIAGPNSVPTARIGATPSSGAAPLAVAFDGTASSDPEGKPLTYALGPRRRRRLRRLDGREALVHLRRGRRHHRAPAGDRRGRADGHGLDGDPRRRRPSPRS